MARQDTYIVIKLVPGRIEYLLADGKSWVDHFSSICWTGPKPVADTEATKHPGSQVDRL